MTLPVYDNFVKALTARAQQNAKGKPEAYYAYFAGYMDSVLLQILTDNPESHAHVEKVTEYLIKLVEEQSAAISEERG